MRVLGVSYDHTVNIFLRIQNVACSLFGVFSVLLVIAGWRDIDGRAPRQRGQKEALDQLLGQIKEAHRHCVCHGIYHSLINLMDMLTFTTEP